MMYTTSSRLVLAVAVGLGANTYAAAQQADPDAPVEVTTEDEGSLVLETVYTVLDDGYQARSSKTASRLNVPIDEIPINIQAVTGEVIGDFKLLSQRDALQFHAGVDDKRVRGFNTGEFFRNGFIHLSDSPGFTLERVEIVRGATAVLNGPVTPGGALNMVTKRARLGDSFGELGGYWGFSGDDRDNNGVNLDVNMGDLGPRADYGPMAAFRFVGGWQGDTGFGTNVDNQSHAILPTLQFRPFRDTYIDLGYYQYEINTDRADRPMGIELTVPGPTEGEEIPLANFYGIDPRTSFFGETTDIEESVDDWTIGLTQEFGEQFIAQLSYNQHNRNFIFGPGNRPRIDIFYRVLPDETTVDPNDFTLRRLTEQLALKNNIDQVNGLFTWLPGWGTDRLDHRIVFGFDTYDQKAALEIQRPRLSGETGGFYFDFFDPALGNNQPLRFNTAGDDVFFTQVLSRIDDVTQTNFYANYQGNLFEDRLHLLLGVYQSEIDITRTNLRSMPVMGVEIASNEETLLQAGAVFDLTDQFSLYANFSQSQLPDLNDPDFERAPPIRLGEQVEFGTKFEFFDGRVNGNAGLWWIDEELDGETTRDAEANGFDFDIFASPTDAWTLAFSYAYADTEITASSNPDVIGDPLVDEIPHKWSLWGKYDFEPGTQLEGLSIGGALVWTGERVRPTAGAAQAVKKLNGEILRYDPETRLDLFATYAIPTTGDLGYELSLNVRNLTQEANISNTVPRVPLQGGVRPDGSPYVFDGETEVLVSFAVRY
ncbi:MAG: TonB-dependent receptor plug domain-containing protein [Pseudomonadota bacterium]